MVYGPEIPATGAFSLGIFVYGVVVGNWIVAGISLLLMAIVIIAFIRLRKGEKQL